MTKTSQISKKLSRIDQRISQRLRKVRLFYGFSQATLGKAIGCTMQQYQKYEGGQNRIGLARLVLLAEHFNLSPDVFLKPETPTMTPIMPLSQAIMALSSAEQKTLTCIAQVLGDNAEKG